MKKLLAILLAVTLTLSLTTACGKRANNGSTVAKPGVSTPNVPEEPAAPPYTPNVLTGLPYDGTYPQTTRIAAVMINNISNNAEHDIRPQAGLSQADMLIEMKVEGGITRFMGLFADYKNLPERIGPVRSARDQFFQLLLPFQPLYIHIGESFKQTEYRENYEYDSMDVNLDNYAGSSTRDQKRLNAGVASWEIAYSTNETLQKVIANANKDTERTYNSTFFNFINYNEPERELTGDKEGNNFDAYKVAITHSPAYRTYFTYDAAAQRYMMSQYSMAKGSVHDTTDENNGEQLGFKNVMVLFTDFHPYLGHEAKDLQEVDLHSGGVGYYFSNGRAEQVRWGKDGPQGVLHIYDKMGNETDVMINPGKTYLTFVDLEMSTQFAYYPTESTANGSESVVVDPKTVNTEVTAD